jgi:hypothetical protein
MLFQGGESFYITLLVWLELCLAARRRCCEHSHVATISSAHGSITHNWVSPNKMTAVAGKYLTPGSPIICKYCPLTLRHLQMLDMYSKVVLFSWLKTDRVTSYHEFSHGKYKQMHGTWLLSCNRRSNTTLGAMI